MIPWILFGLACLLSMFLGSALVHLSDYNEYLWRALCEAAAEVDQLRERVEGKHHD